jgi:UPF0716 family protein affecting phage T7 exclusion
MNRYRRITFLLALCMGVAWVGAFISISSVIGQPWTAVTIFGYCFFGVISAFATGRESMKP